MLVAVLSYLEYNRKRGSASYIVREVLLVRYIYIYRERERDRRKWRHHCRAKIGDEFTLSLAKNSHNGAFANTSSCAYKSKRAGWQGFWQEHFCRTWREDLCHFSVFTHQFVSCFFFFSEPRKIRRPLQLSLTPTRTLHTSFHQFSLLWWSAAVSTGPVSLTAQPSVPSWRSTTWKKGEACRCRSCPWLLTGITEQGTGKLSTSFLGGIPRCSRLCPWEKWTECMCEALLRRPPSKPFHALEHLFLLYRGLFCILASQVFNFFSSDRHFSSDKFWFFMTVFFFFLIFVFSLFLFCLPRNAFTFVLYYLAILAKHVNISPSASDGMRVLSLCLQSSWHIRTCTRSRSWPFWKFWQNIGLHCEGALRSTMKVQRLPPSARRHARQDLVTMESVLF